MFRARYAERLGLKVLSESENIFSGHLNQTRKIFSSLKYSQSCLPKKDDPSEPVVD